MQVQSQPAIGPVGDRAQLLGGRMRAVVEGRGVLHRQHDRLRRHPGLGRRVMCAQYLLQLHGRMIEQTIRRLGLGAAATGLRERGIGASEKVSRDGPQSPLQTRVPQRRVPKLSFGPVARREWWFYLTRLDSQKSRRFGT